ncbi:MAG: hypothetical protein AAGE94_00805 [Acidobacteriota bacterium]
MRAFRRLKQSIADTDRLQRRFYRTTTLVGLVASAIATVIVSIIAYRAHVVLEIGVLPTESMAWGGQLGRFGTWIGIAFASIPIVFYLSMVAVAGSFAGAQVIRGTFTRREAVAYALFSEYPSHWFEPTRQE